MEQTDKIYIAGHRGMVGSGLERKLRKEGYNNIVTRTSDELDLRNQLAVNEFFEKEKPAYVILTAAKVGGIHANNTYPANIDAAASIESTAVTGDKKEIVIAPFFKVAICCGVNGCTDRTTSASAKTSPDFTVAPAAVKSASVACE